jgi:predicted nuclease of predicted toxin-antitoxin system
MKLLLDTCVWGGTARELARLGHDVDWVGRWQQDPGDDAILNVAHRDARILVTLDKDFGELAIVRGSPPSCILRTHRNQSRPVGPRLRAGWVAVSHFAPDVNLAVGHGCAVPNSRGRGNTPAARPRRFGRGAAVPYGVSCPARLVALAPTSSIQNSLRLSIPQLSDLTPIKTT